MATSKVQTILQIIQAATTGIALIPGGQVPAGIATVLTTILSNALAAYQAETGAPLDLTKIPLETPVP